MKVRFSVTRAAIAAIMLLAAFAAPARAEIKVGVSDWTGWVAWYVAQDQGFFKKYGADVKLVWFANYSDSIAALSTGQLDANSQTWSDTLGPLQKGLPLKAVLINDNSFGNDALMVSPKIHGFRGPEGQEGRAGTVQRVAFRAVHGACPTWPHAARCHRGQPAAGDAAAAFISGRVDAAVVWNPWISQIEKSGKGRALFTSRDMPGLIPDLLVAQQAAIQNKRQDLIGMTRAWFDTVAYIQNNPDAAVKIMSKVVGMNPARIQDLSARHALL